MIEVLQFYVSSFWVWCGLTFGPAIVLAWLTQAIIAVRRK